MAVSDKTQISKFVSDLWQVVGTLIFPPETDKTDRHDVTEILLKVVINTIIVTVNPQFNILIKILCKYNIHIKVVCLKRQGNEIVDIKTQNQWL